MIQLCLSVMVLFVCRFLRLLWKCPDRWVEEVPSWMFSLATGTPLLRLHLRRTSPHFSTTLLRRCHSLPDKTFSKLVRKILNLSRTKGSVYYFLIIFLAYNFLLCFIICALYGPGCSCVSRDLKSI